MQLLLVTILLPLMAGSILTAEVYPAIPIQQYVVGTRYDPYEDSESRENEVLASRESGNPQFQVVPADNGDSGKNYPDAVLYIRPALGQSEILDTEEANNYYRPYIRYRQILSRRTRVPIRRRFDYFPRSSSLSGYASNRDRFPTVA